MKLFRYLGWGCFSLAIAFNIYQRWILRHSPLDILHLEFAPAAEGKSMVAAWQNTCTTHYTLLLQEAIKNTWWDFIFIIGYVSVIIMLSYSQMQREPMKWLNDLLRLNFVLGIIAGLLDTAENMILLYDMAPFRIGIVYHSTYWFTLPKFILSGWVTLVWLISLISSGKRRRQFDAKMAMAS